VNFHGALIRPTVFHGGLVLINGALFTEPEAFEKHLFFERVAELTCRDDFQGFSSAGVAGISERDTSAARAVATPTPSSRPISRQDCPRALRSDTRAGSTYRRGRPSRAPRARAAARPDRTRPRISSRSNSARLAKMPNTRRPLGVEVSTPSWSETN
jgi:hypothetical protein